MNTPNPVLAPKTTPSRGDLRPSRALAATDPPPQKAP